MDVPQAVREKAKKVKLLVLDVDGVLTEGSIIYDSKGRESKHFNVKDGLGIFFLTQAGVDVAILTARCSRVVKKRAKDMRVSGVYCGYPKERYLGQILARHKVSLEEVCFVGDDLIDIAVARQVGLAVAVADACPQLKKIAHFSTENPGGRGAVREMAEILLKAKGLWKWD